MKVQYILEKIFCFLKCPLKSCFKVNCIIKLMEIRITCISAGKIDHASSRLRSYYLFEKHEKLNIKVLRVENFSELIKGNLIHIHQVFSYQALFYILLYRILGKTVVFDFADHSPGFKNFLATFFTLFFASIVSVNTMKRKKYWESKLPWKNIIHIPDVADYSNDFIVKPRTIRNIDKNSFLWFGHSSNFKSIKDTFTFLSKQRNIKLTIISDSKWLQDYSTEFKKIDYHEWSIDFDFSKINFSGFVILSHFNDLYGEYKSNNKMVTSFLNGFIPIVSSTDAYIELAKKIKCQKLIYKKPQDIIKISRSLDLSFCNKALDDSFHFIVKNYSKENVLKKFIKIT